MLTQDRLKELLCYDPETGVFTRKIATIKPAGTVSGSLTSNGYIEMRCGGLRTTAHRLAFLYMTGEIPDNVDHIDHDRTNNKWTNLRSATRSVNLRNCKKRTDNKSGVTGVSWSKACGKWTARIKTENKYEHLGVFADWFDAVCARKSASVRTGYHANHGAAQ